MSVRVRSKRPRAAVAVRRRVLVTAVFAALVMGLSAITVTQRGGFRAPSGSEAATPGTTEAAVSTEPIETSLATGSQRAVFPYSVVPGGVDSVDELRRAIAADPVVADHYRGFDLSTARVERLAAPRIAHVSYRLEDHVYWTRRPLVLPAGERVITDGKQIARTRCGNQVAIDPGITSPAEPDASVLDTPAIPMAPCPICAGAPGGASPGNGLVPPPSGLAGGNTPANEFVPPPSGSPGGAIPGSGFVPAPSGLASGAAPDNGFVPPPSGALPPPEVPTIPPPPALFVGAGGGPSNDGPNVPGTPHDDSPNEPPGTPHSHSPVTKPVPAPVPEPGSVMLMLIGAGGFAVRRLAARRRADQSVSTPVSFRR